MNCGKGKGECNRKYEAKIENRELVMGNVGGNGVNSSLQLALWQKLLAATFALHRLPQAT